MDIENIRLECLRLSLISKAHLDASEVVARAKEFESYITEATARPSVKSEQASGTSGQKPSDTAKEQKNINSKK